MERSLSRAQSVETQALVRMADELESIADYLNAIAHYKARFGKDFALQDEARLEFMEFYTQVWNFFQACSRGIFSVEEHDLSKCERESEKLRIWADDMRDKHIDRISKGLYQPVTAMTYSDMVVSLRKIRAHALNLAEAIENLNNSEER
jgi:phosphate:Na+ symporter